MAASDPPRRRLPPGTHAPNPAPIAISHSTRMICRIQAGSPSLPEKCFKKLLTKYRFSYRIALMNIWHQMVGFKGTGRRYSRGLARQNRPPLQGRATLLPPRSKQKNCQTNPFSLPPKRSSFPVLWEPASGGFPLRDTENRSYHHTAVKLNHHEENTLQVPEHEWVAYNPPRLPVNPGQSSQSDLCSSMPSMPRLFSIMVERSTFCRKMLVLYSCARCRPGRWRLHDENDCWPVEKAVVFPGAPAGGRGRRFSLASRP